MSVLRHRNEIDDYDELLSGLRTLPQELVSMKRIMEPRAVGHARALVSRDYHILIAAGPAWPEACSYSVCVSEEMQWIRVRPVHASDFFHGTLELLEPGMSVVLKGEDATRPLAERVERFVHSIGGSLTVIDTCDFPSISPSNDLRALLTPVILTTVLKGVSAHLEVVRNTPLSTRRYFRRIPY